MKWPGVVEHLHAETKRIWLDEPRDVRRLRRGEQSTEAGTQGQFFSTFDAANHEVRGFVDYGLPPLITCTTREEFSLAHCLTLARIIVGRRMDFASWIGLEDLAQLTTGVMDVLEEPRDLAEFRTLFIALFQYMDKLHFWTTHYFPWGVGALFPHREHTPYPERSGEGRGATAMQGRDWRVVSGRIDAATARIWAQEPADLNRVRMGVSVHGAGSYGQSFAPYDYVAQDVRWLADQGLPLIIRLSRDETFSLAHVRTVANLFIGPTVPFLNWLGLDEYPQFARSALDVLGTVSTKADITTLFVALARYVHRFQGWAYYYFPWGAGALFPRLDIKNA